MTYNVFGGTLNPTLLLYFQFSETAFNANSQMVTLLGHPVPG